MSLATIEDIKRALREIREMRGGSPVEIAALPLLPQTKTDMVDLAVQGLHRRTVGERVRDAVNVEPTLNARCAQAERCDRQSRITVET